MKKVFSLAFLVIAVSLVLSFGLCDKAFAAEKYGDYLYYSVKDDEVTITDCETSAVNIEIPSEIDGFPVTSIGAAAFYRCGNLTSVTIPNGVASIGHSAFSDCYRLTSITLPDSVASIGSTAFNYCYSLTSITIPDRVINIGSYTFYMCESLTSITIPDNVTSIGESAFQHCRSIESVYITDIAAWCNIDFADFNANPLLHANSLYLNNELVTELIIPDSVTSIRNYAFYGCNNLTKITIPGSVTSISDKAFSYCDNLTSVTISDGVTSIGESAFDYCHSLTDIALADSITSIGDRAFWYCTSLTSITIPDGVTNIGNGVFSSCEKLKTITIPSSVTSIGESAFDFCYRLTDIALPNSVANIGAYAFSCCSSLTTVEYGGNKEEWNAITISTDNDPLLNATINYNSIVAQWPEVTKTDSENKYTFSVVPKMIKPNSFIYAAAYDANKKLLKLSKTKMLTSGSTTISLDKTSGIKYVVIYAWSNDLSPISQSKKINIS